MQRFGGPWTDEKLRCVQDYLRQYMVILKDYPKYATTYVDAFAGTGFREQPAAADASQLPILEFTDDDVGFLKGSAYMALEIERKFDHYIFVERSPRHAGELAKLKESFDDIAPRIDIEKADANTFLLRWCSETDWDRNRAVVFLDPYGMQVEWKTVECMARTKGIDLWYLFPLSAVNRLLTRDGRPSEEWSLRLTTILGTNEWKEAFYSTRRTATLFGDETAEVKDTDFDRITEFFQNRLRSTFPKVAPNPRVLRNGVNSPLFLLCFAVASPYPSVQRAALNIASYILKM